MPKPAEETNAEEKIEAEASKITETEDGGVEVAVDEDAPKEQIVAKEKVEDKKPEHRQDPLTNKVYAHDRILSNVQKSIEELKDLMVKNSNASTVTSEQETKLDELDELAQKDWKAAVGKIADARVQEILASERKSVEAASRQVSEARLMEENSQVVLSKHSELGDETSEKSQLFQDILNQNPRWRTSPDGPLLTMYKMEDELRRRGYVIDSPRKSEAEADRINRVSAAGLPAARASSASNKIILTREQREFCEQNGIGYEDYARTLKKSGDREGIAI
jgi:hypothetical protein